MEYLQKTALMTHDVAHFQHLKTKLQITLQASYPHFKRDIHEWKAQEITALQDALHQKVKGYISEKWFYTHLKPTQNEKLPRIDMLDMLSQYIGYTGWQDFVFQQNLSPNPLIADIDNIPPIKKSTKPFLPRFNIYMGLALIFLLGVGLWAMNQKNIFQAEFCFQDADTEKPITQDIDIWILKQGESPQLQKIDKKGCAKLKASIKTLTFVVKSPYYKTDTITRTLTQGQASELIKLKRDDYALLIQLIAKHGTTEKEKEQRRKQLDKMFDHEAQIFQIDEEGLGIELYSKEEFTTKLALPISSLKNIQIIETQYQKGKIILLRFLQK